MCRKWAIEFAALLGLSMIALPARADILDVGDSNMTPTSFGAIPVGQVIASQTVTGSISGPYNLDISVYEQVVLDSVTGHLDFLYTLTNLSTSNTGVIRFTATDFGTGSKGTQGPWSLDVGYDSTTQGRTSDTVDRLGTGETIGWNFYSNSIAAGASSRTLVIKTTADYFAAGFIAITNSHWNVVNLAGNPSTTPEPSTLAIAGLAGLGMLLYARTRRRRLSVNTGPR
jgi:hypothetical protein